MKKAVYSKLNTNINILENKIPDVSTLLRTSQCNTDKQNLEKNIG